MGQRATVPVHLPPAVVQSDNAPKRKIFQRDFGLLTQRPGDESGPTRGNFGRLNADEAHFSAALQHQRIADNNSRHDAQLTNRQRARRLLLSADTTDARDAEQTTIKTTGTNAIIRYMSHLFRAEQIGRPGGASDQSQSLARRSLDARIATANTDSTAGTQG